MTSVTSAAARRRSARPRSRSLRVLTAGAIAALTLVACGSATPSPAGGAASAEPTAGANSTTSGAGSAGSAAAATGSSAAAAGSVAAPASTASAGGSGNSATSAASAASAASATNAKPAATATPAVLKFSAPKLGGGTVEGAALAGRPVAFWFWAPT